MVIIPAIDILGGKCVRLFRGDYEQATVYSDDPSTVAAGFAEAGAQRIHVVDLDAARGSGDNGAVIASILRGGDIKVQVAGGVRTAVQVDTWLGSGAHAVVMGTAAVRNPSLLDSCARRHPGQVLAALDVRDNKPSVSGWTETEPVAMGAMLARWDLLPLGGVILTCIQQDGTLEGPDLKTLERVRAMTGQPLQYSGGISTMEDIRLAGKAGAMGVILGKALYEGHIVLKEALAL